MGSLKKNPVAEAYHYQNLWQHQPQSTLHHGAVHNAVAHHH